MGYKDKIVRVVRPLTPEAIKYQQSAESKKHAALLEELNTKIKEARQTLESIEANCESKKNEAQKFYNDTIIEANKILAEAKSTKENSQKYSDDMQARAEKLLQQAEKARASVDDLIAIYNQKTSETVAAKEAYDKALEQFNESRKQLNSKREELGSLVNDYEKRIGDVAKRESNCSLREAAIEKLLEENTEKINKFDQKIIELNAKILECGKTEQAALKAAEIARLAIQDLQKYQKDIDDAKKLSQDNTLYAERLKAKEAELNTWEKALNAKNKELNKREENVKIIETNQGGS